MKRVFKVWVCGRNSLVRPFKLLVENLYLSSPFFLWTIWNLEDKKIIVTFSAPKKAMSDKPNSNITKSRKKLIRITAVISRSAWEMLCSLYKYLHVILYDNMSSLSVWKISMRTFWSWNAFSPVFTIFVKNSENINLFNLSQKKTRKYSGSVIWIHDFIYELNLATAHVVDGHEIGRGLQFLRPAC